MKIIVSIEYLLPCDLKQTYVVRAESNTNSKYGYKPTERPLEYLLKAGVINLDKVSGPTSHEVAAWVRKILGIPKTGHGGTLDPHVTGVLPIALGKATKVMRALLNAGKEYICAMYLHNDVDVERIKKALNLFSCELYQRPPLKSAVARKLRKRTVYYIDFIEKRERFVLFRVGCESGTYIRKLCYDIGEVLLSGAHMAELRRTRSGNFVEEEFMFTLQDLKDAVKIFREERDERYLRKMIIPMEKAVSHWKKIYIRDSAVDAIAHGAKLAVAGVLYLEKTIEKDEDVAVMTQKGELVAFGKSLLSTQQILKRHHGICAVTEKVFIPRGLYPHWNEEPEELTSEDIEEK